MLHSRKSRINKTRMPLKEKRCLTRGEVKRCSKVQLFDFPHSVLCGTGTFAGAQVKSRDKIELIISILLSATLAVIIIPKIYISSFITKTQHSFFLPCKTCVGTVYTIYETINSMEQYVNWRAKNYYVYSWTSETRVLFAVSIVNYRTTDYFYAALLLATNI